MRKLIWILATMALLAAVCISCNRTPRLGRSSIKRVISAMTLEEKVRMVVGTSTDRALPPDMAPGIVNRESYPGGPSTHLTQNQVPGAAGDGYAIPRLGIPSIVYADGPAGLRINPRRDGDTATYYCTAFPTATLLAASWDPAIVEKAAEAIGDEVREYGVDILLAPGMNIQRNPLTGRNFEYFSEDPFLTGVTAAAYVRGVQSQGVGTSVKHFAVNNQERYRNGIDAVVDESVMRELYLKAFEKVVKEARPWTVMSSYNKINGTYASENKWLLTDVLRGEWGFDGFVMTDWWGADDPVAQMTAGNNLLMPGTPNQIEELIQAVKDGRLDEKVLDRNIEDILRVILKTPKMQGFVPSNRPDLEAHDAIAREIATEGMVLLRNDGVLPLEKPCRIALFGNYSYDTQPGGSGSGYVNRKRKVNLSEGLVSAGFNLDENLSGTYSNYISEEKSKLPEEFFWYIPTAAEMTLSDKAIAKAAGENDIAVLTIGRMSGEGGDRSAGEGDYLLSELERSQLGRICAAFHRAGKKVVTVLNIGAPIELTGWDELPDALLLAWLPGQQAGNAITDILTGKVNPSGKLPVSFAKRYADIPSSKNFGVSEGELNRVIYAEGLNVGHRYFATSGTEAEYPFGYGLSYTDFKLSGFSYDNGRFRVSVRNSGSRPGREVVQIYGPGHALAGFKKTALLDPGKTEDEEIVIDNPVPGDYQCGGMTITIQ